MGGERALRVEESLGQGYVRLRISEAERRQAQQDIRCVEDAVIELLRNARDAGARHIYVATWREGTQRGITLLDDGHGIPLSMHTKIFEARVTSKLDSICEDRWGVHGRGMALFSIHEHAEYARVCSSAPSSGTAITAGFDTQQLTERADQSTWPTHTYDRDAQTHALKGPHNIVRACCEFALGERGKLDVFLGSPAEIVATARARVTTHTDTSELLFMDSFETLPVLERLKVASDAHELQSEAEILGLTMSERTAHRIMANQVKPLRSVASLLTHTPEPAQRKAYPVDLLRDRRGLKLSKADVREFSHALERSFDSLADKYYLSLTHEPKIRVSKDRITVTFNLREHD